jgi:L-lysine exporter family protein LysE/ArgO
MFDTASFAHGLALGLGMFVCPGPKDVVILREAASRRSAATSLIGIAVASDALLIWLGIAGVSAAFARFPGLEVAMLWFGVGFMLLHAARAAGRALGNAADATPGGAGPASQRTGLSAVAAVSLFNPVAWLDTVIVIGGVGAALPQSQRWLFAGGAIMASLAWFIVLVGGASFVGRWMASATTWRVVDAAVAITMAGLAAVTALGIGPAPRAG